jgi:3-dehydroquinate synthase
MSTTVRAELGDRSYDIHVGRAMPRRLAIADEELRVLLVSDSNVDPLLGDSWADGIAESGASVFRMVVAAGEASKVQDNVTRIQTMAVESGLDRTSCIVALGGGMVGDLAGFAAATFLRGIRLAQVPTSLLAMVDSAVGGKTGVNLPAGKNLVGSFHQPVEVIADIDALASLPDREYRSGLAEVVKYGVICDEAFFDRLEDQSDALVGRDPDLLELVVARCCELKAQVVETDEREGGLRAILNFGHTLGHAIENVAGYGEWLHGEAVSIGMAFAVRLSTEVQGLPGGQADRIVSLLTALGLPVDCKKADCLWGDLREAMVADKKTRGAVLRFVLADRMGHAVIGCEVQEAAMRSAFKLLEKA